jgi:hypothetical protein
MLASGISPVATTDPNLTGLSTKAVDNFVDEGTRCHAIAAANAVITALIKK